MKFQNLKFELSKITVLFINRPRALNTLNAETLSELKSFTEKIGKNQDIRALIITGAGEKSFVAGADIKEMIDFNREQAEAFSKKGQSTLSLIENLPFPVISAINGFALGGGMELALACDIILMSEKAKVGLPEVNLGLFPGFGGIQRLTRAVGVYKAKEMICSGNVYSAKTAFEMGFGNQVVTHLDLMDKAFSLAEDIKKRSPLAVAKAKKLIHAEDAHTLNERLQKSAKEFGKLFDSPAVREGMLAFLEKRKPDFS